LIDAASFALKIFPIGEIPARESHIRPLLERLSSREGYTDDDRISVWRDVLARANGSHIKASDVDDANGPAMGVTEHCHRYDTLATCSE
jgi:hypothetical protein